MKKNSIKKNLLGIIGLLACTNISAQEIQPPTLSVHNFGDQSCIRNISDNGKWAVSFGTAVSDASNYTNSRLINIETGEVITLGLENDETPPLTCAAYDVADNGTVAGTYKGMPAIWTKNDGWKILPLPAGREGGNLECITPDGKYAVGRSLNADWTEKELFYDLETGKQIETPGIPTVGSAGEVFKQMRFNSITADGRYITGVGDFSYTWNTVSFIYDRQTGKCIRPGFKDDGTPVYPDVVGLEGSFSPNGKLYAGSAYIVSSTDEYNCPFIYNMESGEFKLYDSTTGQRFSYITIDNEGIMYGSPASESSPLRTLYIFVDGFWYPLDDLLKLRYGLDFYGQSGYDNTGTCMGVSGNGKVLAAFPDPFTSYTIKMNESFADAARNVNILRDYIATPADGSALTSLKSVTVEFKYDVNMLGNTSDVKLTDKNGTSHGRIVSVQLSNSSKKQIIITFRSTSLTVGEEYMLTIPAGFVSLVSNTTRTNEEIVLHYTGREKVPVKAISATPEEGSSLRQLDVSTNPVLITYDTNVKLAEGAQAYLYRDSETEPVTTLNLATSQTSVNLDKVMVYPTSTQYLFLGSNYRIVIPAGTVTDSNGDNACDEYTLNYEGLYERIIISDNENIYTEDFTNGVNNMLLRDGDGNTPNSEMQSLDFRSAGDSYAWVPVRDEGSTDFAAASTSAYSPAGQSDDWMTTPQIYIPDEKCRLDFDAQGFRKNKSDKLKVIIYADETVHNYLTADLCKKMRTEGKVIFDDIVSPGNSEDNLAGEWTALSFKLEEYAGKSIYVAFVNENNDQSLVIVDNIKVVHDTGFLTALTSETTVVNKESMPISGRLIVTSAKNIDNVSVKLLDTDKNVIDEISENGLSLSKDDKYDFTFANELPLKVGKENTFYFAVQLGEYSDEVAYTVKDLAFKPEKRVLIEENTGMTCGFCPLGHVAWEHISALYGDKVMLAAYHTYNGGDTFASGMTSYVQDFLGLAAAPTARINRSKTVSSPMYDNVSGGKHNYGFTSPDGSCWLDIIQKELETDADAAIDITATYDAATSMISVPYTAKFAMDMEKQNIGLFLIVTEDGLTGFQDNNFSSMNPSEYSGIEDWCAGGKYGSNRVYPYTQSEVARAHVGNSNYGTVGYIPATITGGEEYTGNIDFAVPSTVSTITNCKVFCVMIDANTGRVINNAQAAIVDPTGIAGIPNDAAKVIEVARYNAAGQMISAPQHGLNIIKMSDGTTRKVIIK